MQVFKLSLKIFKKSIPMMAIYLCVFLMVSMIMTFSMTKDTKQETSFNRSKTPVAVIAEENTPLTEGLIEELSKSAYFMEIKDDPNEIQDTLYYRFATYILRIPEGFTEGFLNGEEVSLEKTTVPDSFSSVYIDMAIEKYLNAVRLYVKYLEGGDLEQALEYAKKDMDKEADVVFSTPEEERTDQTYANYFFNYMTYSLFSVMILGISALMLTFNDSNIKRRNACAPVPGFRANIQLFLSILFFTFVTWLIMVAFCVLFNLRDSMSKNMLYFLLNSAVFAVTGAGTSFLIGSLVKSKDAIPAVSNIVTIGISFISGVFVPQDLIGTGVLRLASFTPAYWYVRGNNIIAGLSKFTFESLEPVFNGMLIQLGFAVAFLGIALVTSKKRRYEA
ncbi:MAG: ABC transporter permease [Clostridia bacterium]|jgi:ABC-2 type transport system permease protein